MRANLSKISVIIPIWGEAYNKYLGECLESVFAQTYPNIEIIIVGSELSLPVARNLGISRASGEWVVCLDADDKISPDYIEKCLKEPYDVVGGGIQEFGDYDRYTYIEQTNDFTEYNKMQCSALFKKEMWEKLGGYDEALKLGYEDWDYYHRASKAGYRFKMIDEPIFFYRKHGETMVKEASKKHNQLRQYITNKI
jgi:glycosyltransferase involved in cell wall biosynthesis